MILGFIKRIFDKDRCKLPHGCDKCPFLETKWIGFRFVGIGCKQGKHK